MPGFKHGNVFEAAVHNTVSCGGVLSPPAQPPFSIQKNHEVDFLFLISEELLVQECQKLIRKHERYMREMRNDDVRRSRRSVTPNHAILRRPKYWDIARGFNPYHVRSNAAAIARAVNIGLRNKTYRPRPPIAHRVEKSDGNYRTISVFQIVDSLVSRHLYNSLMAKNKTLMSARSYAYRDDLSSHDAIQYISSEFKTAERVFVAEYDFSKFFDSISHKYIDKMIKDFNFLVTPREKMLIESFTSAPLLEDDCYENHKTPTPTPVGLPQGTSVSLFLANVAAAEIDRSLERIGVGFVRYADDTLIWSRDYGQICEAVNVLKRISIELGADLNRNKSKGVRLFTPKQEPSEIQATHEVNFVGYRFRRGKIGLKAEVIDRMKIRIRYLVWSNLLQSLQQQSFQTERIDFPIDRDYVVLILQLRRYLYGNLTEEKVRELERGEVKQIRYPGILSYFPLVNDQEQLGSFDGWLVSTLHQALGKRTRMILSAGYTPNVTPHGLSKNKLLSARGTTSRGEGIDLRVPSVARFASIINRAADQYGANVVGRGTGAEAYQYSFSTDPTGN